MYLVLFMLCFSFFLVPTLRLRNYLTIRIIRLFAFDFYEVIVDAAEGKNFIEIESRNCLSRILIVVCLK